MNTHGGIFVSLGSNMGEAERHLEAARQALLSRGLEILAESSIYLTEPQGYRSQPWFCNQVLQLGAGPEWTPERLLDLLLEEEARLGRVRSQDPEYRFGPRVIDMDLLLFGASVVQTARLWLPHPRLAERAFVLVPLAEIAPDLVLPDGRSVQELLRCLAYRVEGRRIFQ
ncbi:MAG: 2-amino-4-hydroxy-6-hydroxymethyldihydropteridine diphosphokinase [Desulfovibrionaceae bacterium]|nr:2-amino-4-hydroxy-6-hydroxymethyldihydropteridine diphosphokinase [Deltaproteobacteria bacterium]MBR5734340.1 2-amino-4-hydroxy-6-hydroxymethyldihydropteridine diphosphokinase [Desulfovibrionaceae bacterium]